MHHQGGYCGFFHGDDGREQGIFGRVVRRQGFMNGVILNYGLFGGGVVCQPSGF